jgi:hypothetical protein
MPCGTTESSSHSNFRRRRGSGRTASVQAVKHKAADFAKFWKAYKKADWNVSKVALESNVPYATWQHRIRSCKAAGYKEEGERVDKSRQTPVATLSGRWTWYGSTRAIRSELRRH